MDFIEELRNLSTRIAKQKDLAAQNEQATRNALVEPFIGLLGYDVHDLTEVKPESDADFGTRRGKKADYAILKDNAPIMLIECKPYSSNLDGHISQLQGYFAADDHARIGILTDGGLYRFYSDLEKPNKMDSEPFLEFDIFDIQESLVKELERFTKSKFDLDSITNSARDLKYRKEIKDILRKQLESPTESFVRFFLPSLYSGTRTQAVVQQFRGIVKQAFNEFISEQQPSQSKLDGELAAEPDNSPEQSTDEENRKQNPGKVLIFDGKRHTLDSYQECWIKCCKILFKRHSDRVEELLEKKFGKERRSKFSKKSTDFLYPSREPIGETDIYVDINLSRGQVETCVKRVARYFGHEASIEGP